MLRQHYPQRPPIVVATQVMAGGDVVMELIWMKTRRRGCRFCFFVTLRDVPTSYSPYVTPIMALAASLRGFLVGAQLSASRKASSITNQAWRVYLWRIDRGAATDNFSHKLVAGERESSEPSNNITSVHI